MRCLLALLLLAPAAVGQKEFGFDNRKASGQPYRTPAETVAGFTVPPEFEVKLFAGEPQVVNPVAFSIDERGRVWVLECFEYPSRTPKGRAPRDRIVILEDTDGDGIADKRTVFAEGKDFPITPERAAKGLPAFDLATGLEVGHGGVYVGAPPYLWKIEAKDDKPVKFEPLVGGFGSQDTHETLNTFQWGPDGWLYGMQGVFTQSTVKPLDGPETRMNAAVWRFHPTTKKFEVYAEGTSNPWGMDWRTTDGQFILACCVIPHLYHIVPGGIYKRQAGSSYNPHAYEFIQEISDHTFHRESGWAHAGLLSLDVPHMPARFRDSVIFGSIHGCSLKQNVLSPKGSSYLARRGDDFLTSADKNFRPINLKWGPHGDIYLIDWHDQNPCHQAAADAWDYERGRVYRIQLKERKGGKPEDLRAKSDAELAKLAYTTFGPTARKLQGKPFPADEVNPYRRRTALRLLGERGPAAAGVTVRTDDAPYLRGNAEQVLHAVGRLDRAELTAALKDRFGWTRRAAAIRLAAGTDGLLADVLPELVSAARDENAGVRRELAAAAVRLADTHDVAALIHILMQHQEDAADPLIPHLTWLAYAKVLDRAILQRGPPPGSGRPVVTYAPDSPIRAELPWLAQHAAGNPFVTDRIIPKVVRRLAATEQAEDLDLVFKLIAVLPDPARKPALAGLAVALGDRTLSPPPGWAAFRDHFPGDPLLDPLAVAFRDPVAKEKARATLFDPKRSTADRVEATRRYARLFGAAAKPALVRVVTADADLAVRVEATRQLSAVADPAVGAELVKGWAGLPPAVRAEAVTTLAGRKEWAKALLAGVKAGAVARTDLSDNHITRMQALKDKGVDELIAAAWGRSRATPKELEVAIDQMRAELAKAPGDFTKGKAVFAAQCQKCHQFDGAGASVGPPLDGAGRDIEYILANVLDPNRVIGAPYFQRIVTLQDGRVEQGVLAEEDDASISLKVENGVVKRFARADLDGPVKVVEKSLMPEGLAAGMSVPDFRDLVVYLMASPFPAAVTVGDKSVSVPVTGLVTLPAGDGKPVTVTLKVSAAAPLTTAVAVGSGDPFTLSVDGKVVGEGKGGGMRPDAERLPVTLAAGEHTITLTLKWSGRTQGVYVRVLDPERRLR